MAQPTSVQDRQITAGTEVCLSIPCLVSFLASVFSHRQNIIFEMASLGIAILPLTRSVVNPPNICLGPLPKNPNKGQAAIKYKSLSLSFQNLPSPNHQRHHSPLSLHFPLELGVKGNRILKLSFIFHFIMQQVLRNLYEQHHDNTQRKRIDSVLGADSYTLTPRKKHEFRNSSKLNTPETLYSLDQEIRFEKDFISPVKYHLPELEAKFKKKKVPLNTNKQKRNKLKRRLKAAFLAVLFTQRLKSMMKGNLLKLKKRAQKYSYQFVSITEKLIHNYYQKLLKQQFSEYRSILGQHLLDPSSNQDKEIMLMLNHASKKLSNSSLTKQAMGFFVFTCTNQGFPPSDFLSAAELNRLDFSPTFGCLVNVSLEQVRMMLGLGVGIKIFCFYLLFKPWNMQYASQEIKQRKYKLRDMVRNIGSIFYLLLMEEFCNNIPETRTVGKELIANFGVRPIAQLDPFGEGGKAETNKGLIYNQSYHFLNEMNLKYPQLVGSIRQNLVKWISRLSYACLKEAEKKSSSVSMKEGGSSFFKTLHSNESNSTASTRFKFRSIDLKSRHELTEHSAKKPPRYREFPSLKPSLK